MARRARASADGYVAFSGRMEDSVNIKIVHKHGNNLYELIFIDLMLKGRLEDRLLENGAAGRQLKHIYHYEIKVNKELIFDPYKFI